MRTCHYQINSTSKSYTPTKYRPSAGLFPLGNWCQGKLSQTMLPNAMVRLSEYLFSLNSIHSSSGTTLINVFFIFHQLNFVLWDTFCTLRRKKKGFVIQIYVLRYIMFVKLTKVFIPCQKLHFMYKLY